MFEMRSLNPHFSVYKACIHLRTPNFDFSLRLGGMTNETGTYVWLRF